MATARCRSCTSPSGRRSPRRSNRDLVVKPERNWRRVHATVPPGFVTDAEVLAARGQIERALDGLRHVLRQPDAFPLDEFVAAQRAMLRIAVRMRLAGEMPSSPAGLRTAEDYGLLWMLSTLVSPYPASVQPAQPTGRTSGCTSASAPACR